MLSFMLKVDVLAIKERESCLGCIDTNFDPNKDSSKSPKVNNYSSISQWNLST